MNPIDLFVQSYFSHVRTVNMTDCMFLVSRIFDVSVYSILLTILLVILIYYVRGKKYACLFGTTMIAGAIFAFVFKGFFNVARPTQAVFETFGQSFPSYHAIIATILFVMLMYVFDLYLVRFWKWLFNLACVFGLVLISFSRLYLGVHWLSDVLVGIFLGLLICYVAIRIFRKMQHI